jgi:succinate dehydrogenase/fumarate reductase flavoprotein subunit
MAYRAGAELVNMEFPMFLPGAFPHPEIVKGVDFPFLISTAGTRMWGAMLNCWGDRFMRHWDPDKLEHTTRDICSVAMMMEVRQGRGSEHGGVYVTFSHLPKTIVDRFEKISPPEAYFEYGGFPLKKILPDLKEDAIEAVPACHFWNGGIRINERCETNLMGLFAAGEVTGGVHGANRLSGNAYTEMVVWGTRSGIFASEFVLGADYGTIDADQVAALKQRVYRPLENEGGIGPVEARKELMTLAWEKVGIIRNGPELEEALRSVREWKENRVGRVTPRDKRRSWNRDWIFALEYENMVQILEMVATAALYRTESRGANYRLDYPMTDNDNWLKNIVAKQEDGQLKLWTEPIVVTKYQPPAGVFPYGKLEPITK